MGFAASGGCHAAEGRSSGPDRKWPMFSGPGSRASPGHGPVWASFWCLVLVLGLVSSTGFCSGPDPGLGLCSALILVSVSVSQTNPGPGPDPGLGLGPGLVLVLVYGSGRGPTSSNPGGSELSESTMFENVPTGECAAHTHTHKHTTYTHTDTPDL